VTLKLKLWIYLGAIHAAIAAVLIWQRSALGWWLFALELALLGSFFLGLRWLRTAFAQAEVARTVANIVEAGEYGTRYPLVGRKGPDAIIETYNRMLATLQQERFRLGEQRGFAEKFIHESPVGILIFDFDRRLTLTNPRAVEFLGVPETVELVGRTLDELDTRLATTIAELAVDEVRMVADAAGRRLRCRRSEFADRGFTRVYVLIEELTAELNRSDRETYEKLIRMMSHEVTNTVAATNSLLESCRHYAREFALDESRADYVNALDVLIARNRSLNEFTRRFSDLVKLPPPEKDWVELAGVVRVLRTMFRAELEARNIALAVAVPSDLPPLSMDRNQMEQVLANVIKNAIEAVDCGGSIEIEAARRGAAVELEVRDSGGALNDAVKARLFTPFFTSKKQGQGLGLTLVKEVLTQHGFTFSLDAERGQTVFRIVMPAER
jgi:signal transduction histidine kinase